MDTIGLILNNQSLQIIAVLAVIAAIVDTVIGVLGAIVKHDFTLDKVAMFLADHLLARVVPILAAAFFAAALDAALGGANVPVAVTGIALGLWALAWGGIAAYLGETVKSVTESMNRPPAA